MGGAQQPADCPARREPQWRPLPLVHVAAAPVALPHLPLDGGRDGAAAYQGCGAGGAACRAHSAFGAEVTNRTAASGRFAGTARLRRQSADAFAGEGAPPAGAAAAPPGPMASFGAEGRVIAPGRCFAAVARACS